MSRLFSPIKLGGVAVPNRIVVSPMCQYCCTDGFADDWHLVHCVHLDRDLPGTIAHNPRSNMNNSVGYARPATRPNRIVLGTDGIGADMLEEARLAYVRLREDDVTASPDTVWQWLEHGYDLFPEARHDRVTWNYPHADSAWHVAFTPGVRARHVVRGGVTRHGQRGSRFCGERRRRGSERQGDEGGKRLRNFHTRSPVCDPLVSALPQPRRRECRAFDERAELPVGDAGIDARVAGERAEPEDHIAILCDVMAGFARGDFAGGDLRGHDTELGKHLAGQARDAHLEPLEIGNGLDFLAIPAGHLGARVACGKTDDAVVLVERRERLVATAIVFPGVLLARVEPERNRRAERERGILANVVIRCGMAAFHRARLGGIEHLEGRHEFAGSGDANLEAALGHLRNATRDLLGGAEHDDRVHV